MARVDVASPNIEALTIGSDSLEAIFGIADRTVRKFAQESEERGVDVRAGRGKYLLAAFLRAYIADVQARADARDADAVAKAIDAARARKYDAEAEEAEIRVTQLRGETVAVAYMERQVAALCDRLRSKHLNIPGKYAPVFVGVRTMAEAQSLLEGLISDVLTTLSETGSDPELDQEQEEAA